MCVIDDVIANLRTTVNNVLAMSIRTLYDLIIYSI